MAIGIGDIIALAKAGYSVNDVKSLIEMGKTTEVNTADSEQSAVSTPPNTAEVSQPSPQVETASTVEEDKTDYKALYEQSQKDLAEAQKANTRIDNSGNVPQEIDKQSALNDLFAEFM